MIHHHTPLSPPPRQRGAALVVALIILLVLTVMGVSGIRQASLEESMAFNSQAKSITFQAAETAIGGVVINQNAVLNAAVNAGTAGSVTNDYSSMVNPPLPTPTPTPAPAPTVTANVTTQYIGWQMAPGYSLKDSAGFAQFNFNLNAVGALPNASASSRHLHGAYMIGPMAGALW